jgi:hypothetical protein
MSSAGSVTGSPSSGSAIGSASPNEGGDLPSGKKADGSCLVVNGGVNLTVKDPSVLWESSKTKPLNIGTQNPPLCNIGLYLYNGLAISISVATG